MITQRLYWEELFYVPPRRRIYPPFPRPAAVPLPFVEWNTKISVEVKWGNLFFGTNYEMYQHRIPVRVNSPQEFKYTFRDQYANAVSLADYVDVFLEVKLQGDVYATVEADFVSKPAGTVHYVGFSFTKDGLYHVQFVVVDVNGVKRYGDPAQVKVVKNVDDLAADEKLDF